jgi:hypothetical protein
MSSPIAQQHPVVDLASLPPMPPQALPIAPQPPLREPENPPPSPFAPPPAPIVTVAPSPYDPLNTDSSPTPTPAPCRNNGMMMLLAIVLMAAIVYLIFYGDDLFKEKSSPAPRLAEF